MAYMNKERKAERMPEIKAVLKKYGMQGTVAVRHHMALVCNIKSGDIDFAPYFNEGEKARRVNEYWIDKHYDGVARDFLFELHRAMLGHDYFNDSDIMIDYHHVSHYTDINIGQWDKPYIFNGAVAEAA